MDLGGAESIGWGSQELTEFKADASDGLIPHGLLHTLPQPSSLVPFHSQFSLGDDVNGTVTAGIPRLADWIQPLVSGTRQVR